MSRDRVRTTLCCALALALAICAARAADPLTDTDVVIRANPTRQPRSSLLRWLRTPADASGAPVPAAAQPAEVSQSLPPVPAGGAPPEPASTERSAQPTRRAVKTVEFLRSDGTVVRTTVYEDAETAVSLGAVAPFPSEIAAENPPSADLLPPLPSRDLSPVATPAAAPAPSTVTPGATAAPPPVLPPPLPRVEPPPAAQPSVEPLPSPPATLQPFQNVGALPADWHPWWEQIVLTQLRESQCQLPVNVDLLVCQALQFSPHILTVQADPEIRRTQIVQEDARFDWKTFVNSRWDDLNDPVGNTLTTGGPNRFKDRKWNSTYGIRKQTLSGGEFEASQRLGWEDQNSRFFVPNPQRTAKLQLSYTQPLLQGSGVAYNESRIVLAQINVQTSLDDVAETLQDHLLRVTATFWELYQARAIYLQRLQFLDSAEQILETLEARQEIDSLRQQILRARSAVSIRRTALIRAAADIRDAESRLKLLVNHPSLLNCEGLEIMPHETPRCDYIPLCRADSLNVALLHRPDISRANQEIRAAGVRLGVAENELLPRLDLIMSGYVYGLAGQNIAAAYGDQFAAGRPSYSAGFEFELPIGNRAARAKEDQRQWELSRAMQEYRAIVEAGLTDVDLALREVETSYLEMVSRWQALAAAQQETEYLRERWLWLGGADRAAAGLLEELLMAQERLVDEEEAFVTAQVRYVVALSQVRRSQGTLLECLPPAGRPTVPAGVAGHDDSTAPGAPSAAAPGTPRPLVPLDMPVDPDTTLGVPETLLPELPPLPAPIAN